MNSARTRTKIVVAGVRKPAQLRTCPAIIDVNLKRRRGDRQSWTFTHTKYWALDEASRIMACREAVNLLDRPI